MLKITLSQDRAVNILSTSGSIEDRDVPALKAGVGKLIRDGKNQVIVETSEGRMPEVLIRELMQLDLLAREMAGRLVVVATNAELRTQLINFARPMTLEGFASRDLAQSFFDQMNAAPLGPISGAVASDDTDPLIPMGAPPAAAPEVAPVVPALAPEAILPAIPAGAPVLAAPSAPAPEASAAAVSAAEEQLVKLKAEIRAREQGETGQLRESVARLENENKALVDRLGTYLVERRKPMNEAAYQARISELEEKIEKLLEEMGQADPNKKDGKS